MKKKIILAFALICAFVPAFAQEKTSLENVNFVLATKSQAKKLLAEDDEFVSAQSDFDRSARLKVSKPVSKEEYLKFVSAQAMDWTKSEKKVFEETFKKIKELGKPYNLEFPKNVYFVKTTGREEGMASYCRNKNVVVISQPMAAGTDNIQNLCIHELFHIYSKNNLDVREKLYNKLGYYKTGNLELPAALAKIKITNPDSVVNNYYFKGTVNGEPANVMPLLLAAAPYDEQKGGEFFEYMIFLFAEVKLGEPCTLAVENGNLKLIQFDQVTDYMEKVGMNTDYVIHAEEILADNFVILLNGKTDIPSPQVIDSMKEILQLK